MTVLCPWPRFALALTLVAPLGLLGCQPEARVFGDGGEVAREAIAAPPPPTYEVISLPQATVHWVTIADPTRYPLRVAVTEALTGVEQMAAEACARPNCVAAALNAGFFDPNNGLTTSPVVIDGELVADPRQNDRLMGNPALATYLDKILNRSELRRYDCGRAPLYGLAFHQDPVPAGCTLQESVGAGPQLLPQDTSVVEGFVDPTVTPARDALGSQSPNARSAVGLMGDGSLVLVMVAQVPGVSPSGMSLPELAEFMGDRGVVQALNLDGGSSSTLVYGNTTHYGRLNAAGEPIQRPVKSILWVETP